MTTLEAGIKKITDNVSLSESEAKTLIEKSLITNELIDLDHFDEWFEMRLRPNIVNLTQSDYLKACLSALKTVKKTHANDYGSSRKRDFAQIWSDMIRGYLGELAVIKYIQAQYGFRLGLDHTKGDLENFLSSDIHSVALEDGTHRKTNYRISIKTTKINGIWLDIPNNQFDKSDAFIFVKLGIHRDHLLGFLKSSNSFDNLLNSEDAKAIVTDSEKNQILEDFPDFKIIPAYICGYVEQNEISRGLPAFRGKKGKKHYTVQSWEGRLSPEIETEILKKQKLKGMLKFEGMGRFSHHGYIFSGDRLRFKPAEWEILIRKL